VAEVASQSKQLIYVIDGDEVYRQKTSRLLHHLGYSTALFSSAEDFLQDLPAMTSNSCVIADMRLPGMTGLELLQKLRGMDNELPFIIITNDPDISRAVEVVRHKASDYIVKPVVDRELARRIESVFNRHDTRK
jgi:two-component system response regulator FixJ